MTSAETGPEDFLLACGLVRKRSHQPAKDGYFRSRGSQDMAEHTAEHTAEQHRGRRGHMTASLGSSLERCHDDRIHDGERADTNDRELNPLFVPRSRTNLILTRERPLYQPTAMLAPFRNIASRSLGKPHTHTFRILFNHCTLDPIRFASTAHARKYVWFTH